MSMTLAETLMTTFKAKSMHYEQLNDEMKADFDEMLTQLVNSSAEILAERAFSADPRNTDNAWVVSTVINMHDTNGRFMSQFGQLKAEIKDKTVVPAVWKPIHRYQHLYASHSEFLRLAAIKHNAFW
jgi:hypothetical protein